MGLNQAYEMRTWRFVNNDMLLLFSAFVRRTGNGRTSVCLTEEYSQHVSVFNVVPRDAKLVLWRTFLAEGLAVLC